MKKIVLTFGFISGAILSAMMAATVPFVDKIGFDKGMIIGYTTMILSFLLVFFGVRSYRENVGNGEITFPRALGVGLLIMVIASACYVATWEIVYFKFLPDFGEKYTSHMLDQLKASGRQLRKLKQSGGSSHVFGSSTRIHSLMRHLHFSNHCRLDFLSL
ncbi:MAG TPA: DUF4199 domain-containing protein [Pyrinomonadaceae bacterium]|jgi:hypothetical protein|nr:DUF4199 domain-containing protein [Pyrinomonadaceae bacterium]